MSPSVLIANAFYSPVEKRFSHYLKGPKRGGLGTGRAQRRLSQSFVNN